MKIEKKSNEAIIEPIEDNWNWLDELGEPRLIINISKNLNLYHY